MLTDKQRDALLVELHKEIEASADKTAQALQPGRLGDILFALFGERQLVYPPNGGLTTAEAAAVEGIATRPETVSALRKIIASAISEPFSRFFALLDALGDPGGYEDFWPPFEISESENSDNLDELWLDGYWLWRERRPDPGWKLDTWEGP